MGCYNCEYLNKNDKKYGNINGCLHYCSKSKDYVNGASDGCDKYAKDYGRTTYENNKIYNSGRNYYNGSDTPLSVYMLLIIILIIITVIVNV